MQTNEIYRLDDSWKDINEIIPYGYGRVGRRVLAKLKERFQVPFIIDNNPKWRDFRDEKILSLDEAVPQINGRKIVVLTTELAYISIKKDLDDKGLKEYRDFCLLSRFLGEWYLKYEGKLYVSKVDTVINSRCTLSCPHCLNFIPYCKDKRDYPLEELKKNFDTVFSVVDYVLEYSLFGGEPLIYQKLDELVSYLMDTYGRKIGKLVLITNGNVPGMTSEKMGGYLITSRNMA